MGIGPSGIACTVNSPCYTGIGTTSHTYVSNGTYTATLLNSAGISVATVPIVVSGAAVSLPIMSPHAAAPPSIKQGLVVGGITNPLPTISSFAVTPASITQGSGATLSWSVSGTTSLSISGIGEVKGTSIQVSPTQTTNYTLTANNGQRSATAQTTVTVSSYRWRRVDRSGHRAIAQIYACCVADGLAAMGHPRRYECGNCDDHHPLRIFGGLGGLREKPLQHKGKVVRREGHQMALFERGTKAAKLSKAANEGRQRWRSKLWP